MDDLYSEIILDHFKNPHNRGQLNNPTVSATEYNPLCGDKVQIDLVIKNNKVEKVAFSGEGCAISQASASMLTEKLIGLSLDKIKEIPNDKVYTMLGIQISPARVKCALLGLITAKKAAILCQNAKQK